MGLGSSLARLDLPQTRPGGHSKDIEKVREARFARAKRTRDGLDDLLAGASQADGLSPGQSHIGRARAF